MLNADNQHAFFGFRMAETLEQKKADWKTYQYYEAMFDAEHLDAVIDGDDLHPELDVLRP